MLSQVVEWSSHKILNFERPAFNFLNVYLVNSSFVSLNILEVELLQEVVDGLVHVLRAARSARRSGGILSRCFCRDAEDEDHTILVVPLSLDYEGEGVNLGCKKV